MRITLILFTSGEFDLFVMNFFVRLLKSSWTLIDSQNTKKEGLSGMPVAFTIIG